MPLALLAIGSTALLAACAHTTTDVQAAPKTAPKASSATLTGEAAQGDWTTDAPGVRRKIVPADMPKPFATKSIDNGPKLIARPDGAMPKVPAGFQVDLFAQGLNNPRVIITAPNGDLFIAESRTNRIHVLRDADGDGKPEVDKVFASGLTLPFGLAFYPLGNNPQWLYVGNTDSVVRFPYHNGDTQATGVPEMIVPDLPGGGMLRGGGHWSRDLQFTPDGKKLFVSVGSFTNIGDDNREKNRATVLEYNPDGTGFRVYASGIRNAVGLAINPVTKQLWGSVNERDEIGDFLVPDYVTSIKEGGFYGFPWYYIGPNEDPRLAGKHPELRDKVITPDILVQSHSATLDMCFYTASQFPKEYKNDAFSCLHGSWNRARRTGYKVVRYPFRNGKSTGEYEDFMTGFVTSSGEVWGRPVGVTVGKDGSLFITDDGGNVVWRVRHTG
jgi:glucose/arabinose dehydrogenase